MDRTIVPWNEESMLNLNMDDDLSDEMLSSFVMSVLDYPDHLDHDPASPVMSALHHEPTHDHLHHDPPRPEYDPAMPVMSALHHEPTHDHLHSDPPRPEYDPARPVMSALHHEPTHGHLHSDPRRPVMSAALHRPVMSAALDYDPVTEHSIPRPSLDNRLHRALQILEQSLGDGAGSMLVQVWVPMRCGNQQVLSTRGHPFLHNQELSGYREFSRVFTFDAEVRVGSFPDLPGRVFISKVPEWTPDVNLYSRSEFPRVNHAFDHDARGSMALPVFDKDNHCCAVLELVTKIEKLGFDEELESACRALQAVGLSSTPLRQLHPQSLFNHQKATLVEIKEILNVICNAYKLPLALTWIPCTYTEDRDSVQVEVRQQHMLGPNDKSILCAKESACYWKDDNMQRFAHACAGHFLEEGQGIVGKAFLTNQPFYSSNVKGYDIMEYPLAHHARKAGLNAGFAIRLRSASDDENDYVLELFLPANVTDDKEQQCLIGNIYDSMLRLCASLRQVSNEELVMEKSFKVGLPESSRPPPIADCRHEKGESSSQSKRAIKPRIIQSHFCEKMKDAAKSLGVSTTTLKTKCRKHGIPRWPSRKLNTVNILLKKIKDVLNSIEAMEGDSQFNRDLQFERIDRIIEEIVSGISFSLFNTNYLSNVRKDDESPWFD